MDGSLRRVLLEKNLRRPTGRVPLETFTILLLCSCVYFVVVKIAISQHVHVNSGTSRGAQRDVVVFKYVRAVPVHGYQEVMHTTTLTQYRA